MNLSDPEVKHVGIPPEIRQIDWAARPFGAGERDPVLLVGDHVPVSVLALPAQLKSASAMRVVRCVRYQASDESFAAKTSSELGS